ncbi:MAG: succinate dehydrogenase cytochrome b subunit [Deltaproteobacteria bacterium]|nr:succinate dehydrogenase cytochrome b subunit [Deltaproteobacteria bacterium]
MIRYLTSSIGRKQLTGMAGLGLALFVLTHMAGNFLIFVGPEAYNTYSHNLISSHLIYIIEAGLVTIFGLHFLMGIILTIRNRMARPQGYAKASNHEKKTPIQSRTMMFQGSILAVFVIYHLITFKFGPEYTVTYNGVEMRDLYRLTLEIFHNRTYVGLYVFCLLVLGVHLSHGFASGFQSLGLKDDKWSPVLEKFGIFYAVVVTAGFISQPLYVFFKNG